MSEARLGRSGPRRHPVLAPALALVTGESLWPTPPTASDATFSMLLPTSSTSLPLPCPRLMLQYCRTSQSLPYGTPLSCSSPPIISFANVGSLIVHQHSSFVLGAVRPRSLPSSMSSGFIHNVSFISIYPTRYLVIAIACAIEPRTSQVDDASSSMRRKAIVHNPYIRPLLRLHIPCSSKVNLRTAYRRFLRLGPMSGPRHRGPVVLKGTKPGLLDSTQAKRILDSPLSTLAFAIFSPGTAVGSHSQAMTPTAFLDVFPSKRIVIETLPGRIARWRFVPRAVGQPDIEAEGTSWPKVVDLCG